MKGTDDLLKVRILSILMEEAMEEPGDPTHGVKAALKATEVGIDVMAGILDCVGSNIDGVELDNAKEALARNIMINIMSDLHFSPKDLIVILSQLRSTKTILKNLNTGDMCEH